MHDDAYQKNSMLRSTFQQYKMQQIKPALNIQRNSHVVNNKKPEDKMGMKVNYSQSAKITPVIQKFQQSKLILLPRPSQTDELAPDTEQNEDTEIQCNSSIQTFSYAQNTSYVTANSRSFLSNNITDRNMTLRAFQQSAQRCGRKRVTFITPSSSVYSQEDSTFQKSDKTMSYFYNRLLKAEYLDVTMQEESEEREQSPRPLGDGSSILNF